MKAKIKETGEVVETTYQDSHCCYCESPDGNSRFIPINKLEYLKPAELIDWEQRRHEIAKEVITTLLIHPESFSEGTKAIVRSSINYADALIEKLKENK